MPNHITNIIKARPEVLNALISEGEGGKIVDFNNVIPKPKILEKVTADGSTDFVSILFGDVSTENELLQNMVNYSFKNFIDQKRLANYTDSQFENFIKCLRAKRETGYTSWYDWNCDNWGTKWNAYDQDISEDGDSVTFNTAWSCPFPVIEKLSKMFPDDVIEVQYADEDIGHNCGHLIVKNGEVIEEKELFDPILFAYQTKGWDINEDEYYKVNPETGKYEYVETDE